MKYVFTLITALVFAAAVNAQSYYIEKGNGLTNGYVNRGTSAGFAANEVYAAGYDTLNGIALYKSTNNGDSWSKVSTTGISNALLGFFDIEKAGNKLIASIVSNEIGAMYTSTDGTAWTASNTGIADSFRASSIVPVSATEIWISGTNTSVDELSVLYKSTNGGTSWTKVTTSGLPSDDFSALAWTGSKFLMRVYDDTQYGYIIYSSTDGASWTESNTNVIPYFDAYDFVVASPNEIYAMGALDTTQDYSMYVPTIFKSTDNGSTWSQYTFSGMTAYEEFGLIFNATKIGNYYYAFGYDYENGTMFRSQVGVTGIKPVVATIDFNVYPNPVASQLHLLCGVNEVVNVSVIDMLGQEVYSQRGVTNTDVIAVDQLQNGTYLLQVKTNGGASSSKVFVKQ